MSSSNATPSPHRRLITEAADGEKVDNSWARAEQLRRANIRIPPKWFTEALAVPYQASFVDCKGTNIHYLRWFPAEHKQGLVFVHGGGAHAYWWQFIAPFFDDFDCVALCSSGSGDSGHRYIYGGDVWADEIFAVINDAGLNHSTREGPPIIVAHSLGCLPAVMAATKSSKADLGGLVLVDNRINSAEKLIKAGKMEAEFRKNIPQWNKPSPTIVHSEQDPVTQRFKLMPPQACDNLFILDFIAEKSCVKVENGWQWKQDPSRLYKFQLNMSGPMFTKEVFHKITLNTCPLGIIYGSESLLCDKSSQEYLKKEVASFAAVAEIPGAAHHVWLDQPVAFVVALKNILGGFRRSSGSSIVTSRL